MFYKEIDYFLVLKDYRQTIKIEKKIETLVTEDMVYNILDEYKEVLTGQRKNLIGKYILSKVQLLRKVYGEKEE